MEAGFNSYFEQMVPDADEGYNGGNEEFYSDALDQNVTDGEIAEVTPAPYSGVDAVMGG